MLIVGWDMFLGCYLCRCAIPVLDKMLRGGRVSDEASCVRAGGFESFKMARMYL